RLVIDQQLRCIRTHKTCKPFLPPEALTWTRNNLVRRGAIRVQRIAPEFIANVFHGHTVTVIGQDEMQALFLDEPSAGRDLRELRRACLAEAEHHEFVGMRPAERLLQSATEVLRLLR